MQATPISMYDDDDEDDDNYDVPGVDGRAAGAGLGPARPARSPAHRREAAPSPNLLRASAPSLCAEYLLRVSPATPSAVCGRPAKRRPPARGGPACFPPPILPSAESYLILISKVITITAAAAAAVGAAAALSLPLRVYDQNCFYKYY